MITASPTLAEGDLRELRALFLRQAEAETAGDLQALEEILLAPAPGEPDPVSFVARAYRFWGREAVIDHFSHTFEGVWAMEPDEAAIRILPLAEGVAHIYAPCRITLGAAGEPPRTAAFLINEVAVRTAKGWRIVTIIPVPAA